MDVLDMELRVGFCKTDGVLRAEYKDDIGEVVVDVDSIRKSRSKKLEDLAFGLYTKVGVSLEVGDVGRIGSLGSEYYALSTEEKFSLVLDSLMLLPAY